MSRIRAFVYSYKNRDLPNIIKNLKEKTLNTIEIHVRDQHPLDRSKLFEDMENVVYSHEFWDHNYGPVFFKTGEIDKCQQEFLLIMSDDIMVSNAWDDRIINFMNNHDVLVSGNYSASVVNDGKFDLKVLESVNHNFSKTSFVDSKFMFAKPDVFKKLEYPLDIKYKAESELLSVNAYKNGINVFAAPSDLYSDTRARILEKIYVPFSLEHGYGKAVRTIKDSEWAKQQHRLDINMLQEIPYVNDDPLYDMDKFELEDQDIGGQRFTYGLKAIY